ncbi:MAG: oxygenase MpaB family protein [Lapillicoccus sp.]
MTTVTPRPPQVIAGRHTADDGLFGPDSVTWRLHSEPSMVLVGILAATTQMLHPRVMRMIDQASSFRDHPESRGRQTGLYVMTITFGDEATARRAGATLRRVHQAVRAIDPATGAEYDAEEPDLLVWVQNTLTYSSLTVFERYVDGGVSAADRDRYIVEQKIAGELLGIDPSVLPSTYAELQDYLDEVLPHLAAIPESLWFRDMMTSRKGAGNGPPARFRDELVGRLVKDEALSMMLPVHRELFGIDLSRGRRLSARIATPLMFKALESKLPTGATIARIREEVDIEAFGAPRRAGKKLGTPSAGH